MNKEMEELLEREEVDDFDYSDEYRELYGDRQPELSGGLDCNE